MNTLLAIAVFLGCRTNATHTCGLHVLDVDPASGAISRISDIPFPAATFLAVGPDGRTAYACQRDGLAALSFDGRTLRETDRARLAGEPCHVSVSPDGRSVNWAAYSAGCAGFVAVADGRFGEQTTYRHQPRTEADGKVRKTYCHMMIPAPDRRHTCVVDLGLDALFTYPEGVATRTQPTGAGPRHMGFLADGETACVLFENGNKLGTYRWDAVTGAFSALDELSTLSKGFIGKSYGGALRLTPDRTQAVAANRGDDSLTSFDCDPSTGKLTRKAITPVPGSWPQDFIFATDDLVLVALENTGAVCSMRYNRTRGTFEPLTFLKGLFHPVALASGAR